MSKRISKSISYKNRNNKNNSNERRDTSHRSSETYLIDDEEFKSGI